MGASIRLLVFLLLAVYGAELSAGEARSTNPTSEKRDRIVILGDSITAGYGLDPAQAYPALLQQKIDALGWPYTVANAGVSGDTTAGGLRRVDWALRGGADVLVLALGGNDGLRGLSPEQTAANLTGIVQRAREKAPGVSVIIAGMEMPESMGPQYAADFHAVFPRVAKETGATLLPFLLEGVAGVPELNQADAIHPNVEGQKRVAENVWAVLQKTLEARRQSPSLTK
jgi:acyl-CoA thioesterase-1